MANRTVKDAKSIKGTNPQYLVEKIIRSRIYDSKYWKEECFALTAELVVDKAMALRYIGGVFGGNIKPTPFLCLTLKMLQIQPEKDIIVEFIKNDDFKYVRALGAYYMRLTGTALDCYNYLEPLLNDNRKLRRMNRNGGYELIYMDEFVDELLREERVCDVILPRIQKRHVLEEMNELQPRMSVLENEDEDISEESESESDSNKEDGELGRKSSRRSSRSPRRKSGRRRSRDRSNSGDSSGNDYQSRHKHRDRKRRDRDDEGRNRDRDRHRSHRDYRDRDRDRDRDRNRERERDKDRYRSHRR